MKPIYLAIMTLLVAFGLPVGAFAASADDQVAAAYAAWDQAFNTGDAAKVAAFYTDDAVFLPPTHDVIEGPAGVEKFFAGLFGNGVTGHKLELIEVTGADDEMVVAAAKWSASGKDASGAATTFGGVATHVFERESDGNLKLKLHTFN
ncbi:MAG: SgcJ/EcaC family oxidoreductase [Geminicoccaceae bacterium]